MPILSLSFKPFFCSTSQEVWQLPAYRDVSYQAVPLVCTALLESIGIHVLYSVCRTHCSFLLFSFPFSHLTHCDIIHSLLFAWCSTHGECLSPLLSLETLPKPLIPPLWGFSFKNNLPISVTSHSNVNCTLLVLWISVSIPVSLAKL